MAFTVPAVPTGIKAGVSISPLLVVIFPRRAPLFSFNKLNEIDFIMINFYFTDLKLIIMSGLLTAPDPGTPLLILSTNSIPETTFPNTV